MKRHKRKTKIICTLGPAVSDEKQIRNLAEAGMDAARLNFSHGSHQEHEKRFQLVKKAAKHFNRPLGVIQDLEGHRIRVGKFEGGRPIYLKRGESVFVSSKTVEGNENLITVSYSGFEGYLSKGYEIYIDDGNISLKVKKVNRDNIEAEVISGGLLKENKGINIPQANFKFPAISNKDKRDLEFGLKMGVDYVAQSFVRSPEDIEALRGIMKKLKRTVPIIAKIEDPQGINNIDGIIEAADAVMIARGDMGVSLSLEKVPLIQKDIIHKCNCYGKPVVTATQMLESMTNNKRPTRAEVADVANAVIDGTDLVMLSGETAIGKFPAAAVSYMHKIITNAEESFDYDNLLSKRQICPRREISEAVGFSVRSFAQLIDLDAIVVYTKEGVTAKVVAKFRPYDRIIAVTGSRKVAGELLLYWGVRPVLISGTKKRPEDIINFLLKQKIISKGKLVIFTKDAKEKGKRFGSMELLRV
ncbi:MAG: pyruvate kinase [Candidatus Omnitrophica bacterium]|nr:pyruvate kinase [Candidatus Omnitrophota bacterium]